MAKKKQLDQKVIKAALEYKSEKWMGDAAKTDYARVHTIAMQISEERAILAEELRRRGVDELSINREINAVRQSALTGAFTTMDTLEKAARAAFSDLYGGYPDELKDAYRQIATVIIKNRQCWAAAIMEDAGYTLEDGRVYSSIPSEWAPIYRVQAYDYTLPKDALEARFMSAFSDIAIIGDVDENTEHIATALARSDPKSAQTLAAILTGLIAQKWTLGVSSELAVITRDDLVNARGNVPTLSNPTMQDMHAMVGKRAGTKKKRTQEVEYAFRATKVTTDKGAPIFTKTTLTILQLMIALFYRNNRGKQCDRLRRLRDYKCSFLMETQLVMDLMGMTAETAQKYIRTALKTLEHTIIETEDKYRKGRKWVTYGKGNPRIVSSHKTVKGGYIVYLDGQFAEYMAASFYLEVPELYFSASANASAILMKLANMNRMNAGKSNANLVSVLTLVDACPEINGNRRDKERIVEPLERALEECEPALEWFYQEPGQKPGKGGLSRGSILDYTKSEIMKLNIYYNFKEGDSWAIMAGIDSIKDALEMPNK